MKTAAGAHGSRSHSQSIDLDELARAVAPLVIQHLAHALGATSAPYSTRKGYAPPEFLGRPRVWRETAPNIQGAVRIGRWWSISKDAYARWISSQSTMSDTPANDGHASAWSPAQALAQVGLRPTR